MFGQAGSDKLHGFQSMYPLLVNIGQKPNEEKWHYVNIF